MNSRQQEDVDYFNTLAKMENKSVQQVFEEYVDDLRVVAQYLSIDTTCID